MYVLPLNVHKLCMSLMVVCGPLSRLALVLLMDPDWSWGAGWWWGGGWRGMEETRGDRGPNVCDLWMAGWRWEEVRSSRGSGSTCAGQWQPVKLN